METLISTIVFILPGFMVYFWLQAMGVTPVVKHNTIEFGALSALAWFPVTFLVILCMNLFITPVWTLDVLKQQSNNISFLIVFAFLSFIFSFGISYIFAKWGYNCWLKIVNKIRVKLKKAALSESTSVWEEVFHGHIDQLVGIGKIGENEPYIVGAIEKVSRVFEPDKNFLLTFTDYYDKKYIEDNKLKPVKTYVDIKSGYIVYLYDVEKVESINKEKAAD